MIEREVAERILLHRMAMRNCLVDAEIEVGTLQYEHSMGDNIMLFLDQLRKEYDERMKKSIDVDCCDVCERQIVNKCWSRGRDTHLCKACTKRVLSALDSRELLAAMHRARMALKEHVE